MMTTARSSAFAARRLKSQRGRSQAAFMACLPGCPLQPIEAVGHRVAFVDAARAGRARPVALDDGHGRVVRQFAPQFKFGLEVADLLIERVALVVHGLDRQLVGRHVGFLLAGQQGPLEQQCLLQHGRQRDLGRETSRQQVLVWLVAQRLDDAACNGQRGAAGCMQVLERRVARPRDQFLQGLQLGLVLLLDQRRQPDARHGLGLGAGITRALYLFPENPRRPFGRLLRRRPGLAGQARATGGRDGGRVQSRCAR